jgi:hypothetical protein
VGERALPTKTCASCGRIMVWRKSWARNWHEVRYCSQSCRRSKVSDFDRQLEDMIVSTLKARSRGSSICPSEVARAAGGEGWRELMEPTRKAARRLVDRGVIVIMQHGRVVDPSTAKGPIRLALVHSP